MMNDNMIDKIMRSNIVDEKQTALIIRSTLKKLSDSASKSLGPFGNTTVISDVNNINNKISKDGYTILKDISFEGDLPNLILKMVRKISKQLVDNVGDGSTSAIRVAYYLYIALEEFFDNTKHKVARKDVLDFLIALEKEVNMYIKKLSKKVKGNKKILEKIATISNNNDYNMGKIIADTYKQLDYEGFINFEISPTSETYSDISDGVELYRGYTKYIYGTNLSKDKAEYRDPNILLCNDSLMDEDLEFVAELLTMSMAIDIPLVIIAPEMSLEITNVLDNNRVKYKDKFKVLPIEYSLTSLEKHEEFRDMAAYLGGKVYDKYNGERLTKVDAGDFFKTKLGKCKKILSTETTTFIIEGKSNEEDVKERLSIIETKLKEVDKLSELKDVTIARYELLKRKSKIQGKIANLFVGGRTEIEKKTNLDLVEDSIYACKSAIENGYIIGGNLIIPFILNNKENISKIISNINKKNKYLFNDIEELEKITLEKAIITLVTNAFKKSFEGVLNNKVQNEEKNKEIIDNCIDKKELVIYNIKTGIYEDINTTTVINSAKTDISIMNAVFSIIGLLASSNQMLAVDTIYK